MRGSEEGENMLGVNSLHERLITTEQMLAFAFPESTLQGSVDTC